MDVCNVIGSAPFIPPPTTFDEPSRQDNDTDLMQLNNSSLGL